MPNSRYRFRAWLPETKEFVFWNLLPMVSSLRSENSNAIFLKDIRIEFVNQFTGLTDKNGKEIFEGDIIRISEENDSDHGFYFPVKSIKVVVWIEDGFWICPTNSSAVTGEENICEKCGSYQGLFSENHEISIGFFSEVIGNIYESPELLENNHEI